MADGVRFGLPDLKFGWNNEGAARPAARRVALFMIVASLGSPGLERANAQLTVSHLAGAPGGFGQEDGTGLVPRFHHPEGIATDSEGNVYVADTRNHTIRKITSTGVVTTLAGTARSPGSEEGTGSAARFHVPSDVAIDSGGNVFVADKINHTIRKITPAGAVSTFAGTAGSSGRVDGTGPEARFSYPAGIATDSDGNLYVTDDFGSVVRKIDSAGVVSTLAGAGASGSADGIGPAASLAGSRGIVTDSSGNIYVANSSRDIICMITPSGVVSTLAGLAGNEGSADGTGSEARFRRPNGIAIDSGGNIYVADTGNSAIRKISPGGVVCTLAGSALTGGAVDGTGPAASFWGPEGIATDADGNVYVADTQNSTIRKITPGGAVSTFAGTAGPPGSADGAGPAARFSFPHGVATDSGGNIYVADTFNMTIRRISPSGLVSTLAGTLHSQGYVDGTGPAARFHSPSGIATDPDGNLYVADTRANTIRKITPAGVVSTLAGRAGWSGWVDGIGLAASFASPYGVAIDPSGNLYVADTWNSAIRKITPAGVVSTLAGSADSWGSADGTGSAASFHTPHGVATDSSGNIYVADTANGTVRKVSPAGVVSTLAGTAGEFGSDDGIGPAARFTWPYGIATDSSGNVFVTDVPNHTIRRISPTGHVSTLAGLVDVQGSTDGTGPEARFSAPYGIAVDSDGKVFVADTGNHCIRWGSPAVLEDVATIDATTGCPGTPRQLDTTPRTATAWHWALIGRPAGSTSTLSAVDVRNPTFTPDLPGRYAFRLDASGPAGRSITTASLTATPGVSGPENQVVRAGVTASFTVTPTGSGDFSYQWRKNGSPLPDEILPTLVLPVVNLGDEGFYSCDVTDSCGSVSSPEARLVVVNATPIISLPRPTTPSTSTAH